MSRFCTACGGALRTDLRFCTACGAPTGTAATVVPDAQARRGRWRRVVPVAASTAVVGAVVAAVLLGTGGPAPAPVVPGPVPITTPTTPAGDAAPLRDTARSTLAGSVAADESVVAGLEGSWVPQVASKRVGMVVDGVRYDQRAILAEHQGLATTHPDAVLLESGTFATFSSPGYYVTVIARPFPSAAQANAWCTAEGLPADGCFAKRLSQDVGSGANVAHR